VTVKRDAGHFHLGHPRWGLPIFLDQRDGDIEDPGLLSRIALRLLVRGFVAIVFGVLFHEYRQYGA
jgi:hypothetical protein